MFNAEQFIILLRKMSPIYATAKSNS